MQAVCVEDGDAVTSLRDAIAHGLPRFRAWWTERIAPIDDKESIADELAAHRARLEFHRDELDTLHGYYDGMSSRVGTLLETHENLLKTIQRYAELAGHLNVQRQLDRERLGALEQATQRLEALCVKRAKRRRGKRKQ